MKRKVFEEIFWDSVRKGINPHPDTYIADDLKYYCPEVPPGVIDAHVAKRNKGN